MERHINELLKIIPDLLYRNILDLGAGKGRFMISILKRGGKVSGVEPFDKYVSIAKEEGLKSGFDLDIKQGFGESIPFEDSEFGFVNMTEVIEHVVDPSETMKEVYRVLNTGGKVYISIPNRFGMKDQHFNLYFVNWLPRAWADTFIFIFGKHKDYTGNAGLQRLSDMHYMTYEQSKKLFKELGFFVQDIRLLKIRKRFFGITGWCVIFIYRLIRLFYFDSFHILLEKKYLNYNPSQE